MHLPIRPSWRLTGAALGAAGLTILASACASGGPHQASGTGARPRQATAVAPSTPAPVPSASRPVPTATPTTGSMGSASPTDSPARAYAGRHFTTAQAAMTYLAAAYNSDNTTAMHAVTDAQAFTSLQTMRSSDAALRLVSCTPRPQGDYVCTVRYRGPGSTSTSEHDVAMLIAAPALNPGWYMYRFISGCD
jgi:hypothetical protein